MNHTTDDAKAKRQAALEEKKRRLQELKDRRKRTQQQQQQQRTSIDTIVRDDRSVTTTTSIATDSSSTTQQQNLNDYIDKILSSPKPNRKNNNNNDADTSSIISQGTTTSENTNDITTAIHASPTTRTTTPQKTTSVDEKDKKNYVTKKNKKKVVETFEIGTQTEVEYDILPYIQQQEPIQKEQHTPSSPLKTKQTSPSKKQKKHLIKETKPNDVTQKDNNPAVQEQESIHKFLQTASLKVERLLDTYTLSDVLLGLDHYSIPEEKSIVKDQSTASKDDMISSTPIISLKNRNFVKNHIVSDFQFSKFHKELMIASYSNSQQDVISTTSSATTDGVVMLYNLHLPPDRPEHILQSPSGGVNSTTFHPKDPNIVLGGCTNGDLLLWDVRVNTRLPVTTSKQTLSPNNDWYSISCLECNNKEDDVIIAATNTGSVIIYSMHQLSIPIHTIFVSDFGLSCLTTSQQQNNSILCGDEIGALYSIDSPTSLSSSSSTKNPSTNIHSLNEQHYGMVTDLSSNKNDNIIASCGMDWRTNIYYNDSMYTSTNRNNTATTATAPLKPMISICKDYEIISSVCFHPTIPSILLQSTCNGLLQCYDLSTTKSNYIEQEDPICMKRTNTNINRIRFNDEGSFLGCSTAASLDVYSFHVENDADFKEEVMMENFSSRGFISSTNDENEDDDIF